MYWFDYNISLNYELTSELEIMFSQTSQSDRSLKFTLS